MIKRHQFSIYIILLFVVATGLGAYIYAPKYFADEVYPLKYADSIRKYSTQYNVDPALVAGLIFQESRFNPNSVSGSGAQGLTQFMPGTARTVANEIGLKSYNIFDPDTAIHFTCAHLRDLLDKYNGNTAQALASYNAGTGTVDRLVSLNIFQKLISSNSSSGVIGYVKRVEYYQSVYKAMYSGQLGLTPVALQVVKPADTQAQIRGYFWNKIFGDVFPINQ